jgi:glycerol-3-phosphate dehydrogenase
MKGHSAEDTTHALADFVDERYRGVRPLLWGHQLRQFYLDEMIYRRTLGLDRLSDHGAGDE